MSRNFSRLNLGTFALSTLAAALLSLASSAQAGPILTNLAVWLDASNSGSLTTSGSNVTNWANLVTGPANLGVTAVSQVTTALQPTLTPSGLNGLPVVTFNASTAINALQSAVGFSAPIANAEVFTVWKATAIADGVAAIAYDGETAAGRNSLAYENRGATNDIALYAGGSGGSGGYVSTFSTAVINNAIFGGASSTLSENGVSQTPLNPAVSATVPGTLPMDGVTLGSKFNESQYGLQGYIAEVLIYSSPLSTSDQTAVENYLFQKWFVAPTPTPEPSSLVLLGCACAAVLVRGRKRLVALAAARLGR